jgi:uncharacterized protein YcnI
MLRSTTGRRVAISASIAGLLAAAAVPAQAVNIPEGNAVTPDSTSYITFRVFSACDGLPMDTLEVTIPEGVSNPIPEAVAGWSVEVLEPMVPEDEEADEEAAEDGVDEADEEEMPEPTVVTWSGGSLADGNLANFGMRARFPDADAEVLEFPVIQRCGDVEVEHAPTVTLTQRYGQEAIAELDETVQALAVDVDQLRADVDQLRADVDQVQTQVGDVNVVNLRTRVRDTENAIEELQGNMADLDERVTALEEASPAPEE